MLTETRKADRAKMAQILSNAVLEAGALSADIKPASYDPAITVVRIEAPGGAHIVVDFDGRSPQPNVHVCTWNTADCVFLKPAFGDVNTAHYGKATRIGYGVDHLVDLLQADLDDCASGDAYLAHDSVELTAMAARYAAQGWPDPRQPRRSFAA